MNKYKQGERIYFEMGKNDKGGNLPYGWGKVCGSVGPVVIIELEKPISGYGYTHTYVLDAQIKTPPKEEQSPA